MSLEKMRRRSNKRRLSSIVCYDTFWLDLREKKQTKVVFRNNRRDTASGFRVDVTSVVTVNDRRCN